MVEWFGQFFFSSVGQRLLLRGVSEQAGDKLVGKVAKGLMNERLQDSESGGIACELLGPDGLLGSKMSMNLLKSLVRRGNLGTSLGVESAAHALSFLGKSHHLD